MPCHETQNDLFVEKYICVALTSEPLFLYLWAWAVLMHFDTGIHRAVMKLCFSWMGWLCFSGCGSTSLLVPGAAAQRRLPRRWRGGELAERPQARSHQTPEPANPQQTAGTQTLAHHAAAHPGHTTLTSTFLHCAEMSQPRLLENRFSLLRIRWSELNHRKSFCAQCKQKKSNLITFTEKNLIVNLTLVTFLEWIQFPRSH